MAALRKTQILFEPEEYETLEELARRRGMTVAELVREAVRDRYILSRADRERALEEIFRLEIPVTDWSSFEDDIEQAHADGLP